MSQYKYFHSTGFFKVVTYEEFLRINFACFQINHENVNNSQFYLVQSMPYKSCENHLSNGPADKRYQFDSWNPRDNMKYWIVLLALFLVWEVDAAPDRQKRPHKNEVIVTDIDIKIPLSPKQPHHGQPNHHHHQRESSLKNCRK